MNDFPENHRDLVTKQGPADYGSVRPSTIPGTCLCTLCLLCAVLAAEAAKLAEDGSNAEPAKHAEPIIGLCGLSDLRVK
jgi:hypothetical protein